ncbi:MAG: multidrug transporter [Oscillospiraceae bacterium]
MEIIKRDLQLFRAKLPEWQETYMEKLIEEYASLLNEEKSASEKFWELETRIKKDKNKPGVILEMRKSEMVYGIIELLNDHVICFDDINDFSDELKTTVKMFLRH